MNTREKVLKEALNCVNGEREKQYGNPEDNFQRIADFWGLYLTTLFEGTNVVIELDPKDVAVMMVLFKIARSLGDEDKLDNYVDIIGYAACGAEIFEKEAKRVSDLKKEIDAKLDEANDSYQYFMEKNFGKKAGEVPPVEFNHKSSDSDVISNATIDSEGIHFHTNGVMAESRSCSKKASDNIREFFEQVIPGLYSDPYSWYHDRLAEYISIKAKEKHISLDVDDLKKINRKFPREIADYLHDAAEDCVINGKQLFDCYREIDELLDRYDIPDKSEDKESSTDTKEGKAFWQTYESIMSHIISHSSKANINALDVVNYLTRIGHGPIHMTDLLMGDISGFDDVDAYIDDTIETLKEKHTTFDKYAPNKEPSVDISDFFPKGNPYAYWEAYDKIGSYITISSKEANISQFDVVDHLIKNGHAPTAMAGLLMAGKLSFDDATAFIDNVVKELKGKHKTFEEVADNWDKRKESK